jgi:hypothetical protein
MENILIYTDMPLVSYETVLADIDEVNVMVIKGAEFKDFASLNPSLIILDDVAGMRDVLMTNKLPCPILFVGDICRLFEFCVIHIELEGLMPLFYSIVSR